MLERLLSSTEFELGLLATSDAQLEWERLRLFPDLLHALSNVLKHLDDVPNAQAIRLERILVKFFMEFPHIFPSHAQDGYKSEAWDGDWGGKGIGRGRLGMD